LQALIEKEYHCSGCRYHHPACLFSAKQRRNPDGQRVCIAYEGFVRLCEHKTLSLAEVDKPFLAYRDHEELLRCDHPSHAEHTGWLGRGAWCGLGRSSKQPVIGVQVTPSGKCIVTMSWKAHLPLSKGGFGRTLTSESLYNRLAQIRKSTARFICPVEQHGVPIEFELFDPNKCCCVTYRGSHLVDWQRPTPPPEANQWWRSAGYLDCVNSKPIERRLALQRPNYENPVSRFRRLHDGTQKLRFPRTFLNLGERSLGVKLTKCRLSHNAVDLHFKREIWVYNFRLTLEPEVRMINPMWFQALDPSSYGLENDAEGYGVYWCQAESCRNYPSNRGFRVLPLDRYARFCDCRLWGKDLGGSGSPSATGGPQRTQTRKKEWAGKLERMKGIWRHFAGNRDEMTTTV
jgi:hypothetical protein